MYHKTVVIMLEKQITGRLRICCFYCSSVNIYKVKSLHIYRCNVCKKSFVVPSTKFLESYNGNLKLREKRKNKKIK
jgi:hypothetical protein